MGLVDEDIANPVRPLGRDELDIPAEEGVAGFGTELVVRDGARTIVL